MRLCSVKHRFLFFILTGFILFSSACSRSTPASAPPAETPSAKQKDHDTVVILHTNDVHCAVNDNIGYDGLALYRKELEQEYDHVLLIDAGDAVQGGPYGSLSDGSAIIDLMNLAGYDIAVPGNHEFDYGFEVLDNLSERLNCGYISANFCTADEEPVFDPYRIIEAGPHRIAFISVVTPDTFTKTPIHRITDDTGRPMYSFLSDQSGEKLAECVRKYVTEVREKGADIVILVSHLGEAGDSDRQYCSDLLVKHTDGIDAVIDGHTHQKYEDAVTSPDGSEVLIAQTGAKLSAIGRIDIRPDGAMTSQLISTVPEPDGLPFITVTRGNRYMYADPEMNQSINEMIRSFSSVMDQKIGEAAFDLPIRSEEGELYEKQETGLHDLLTDAYRSCEGAELALVNAGSVREGMEKGVITYRDLIASIPYSNDIFLREVSGRAILDSLEWGARKLPDPNAGFIQGSGITYRIDLSRPSAAVADSSGEFDHIEGEYRVCDVMINGEPLDKDRIYICAMDTFLAKGGDGHKMLEEGNYIFTGITNIDLLKDFIHDTLGGTVPESYQTPGGRIVIH